MRAGVGAEITDPRHWRTDALLTAPPCIESAATLASSGELLLFRCSRQNPANVCWSTLNSGLSGRLFEDILGGGGVADSDQMSWIANKARLSRVGKLFT